MSISFAQLYFVEPTPEAQRLLWHVLSIGKVVRDEPERHEGLDKAGLFLFQVEKGSGKLEIEKNSYALGRGDSCWLLDLKYPRNYVPDAGQALSTLGVRFSGPGMEGWIELLGSNPLYELPLRLIRSRLKRLQLLVLQKSLQYEWKIHLELTHLLGDLLSVRQFISNAATNISPSVSRVVKAVLSEPTRDWKARELAGLSGLSYSRLRDLFLQAQGQTLHEFLQKTRLDHARFLLSDRRLTIKEVASKMNFSSEFYFSHFFHRGTGMSPTQFRERCRA